jgi:hypothetical protein
MVTARFPADESFDILFAAISVPPTGALRFLAPSSCVPARASLHSGPSEHDLRERSQRGFRVVPDEIEKCTTLEFDVGGPSRLSATKTISSATPNAVSAGTVKFTWTVPECLAASASSFGATLPTN